MATVTSPIMTDVTGQNMVDALTDLTNAVKPDASDIPYSNTTSGLSATNVQGAIDEIDSNLNAMFKRIRFSATYNINANAELTLSQSDFNYSVPDGYKALALYAYTTGNTNTMVRNIYAECVMSVKNLSSNVLSNITAQIDTVFVKSVFM